MVYPPSPPPDICEYALPEGGLRAPLLVDLPHGGSIYPPDFRYDCPKESLVACEEIYLDELFTPPVLAAGGVVVKANFPRTYVDVNRAANDMDPLLFDTPWPDPVDENGRSSHGFGVIMRLIRAGEPIYAHPLSHAEARARIHRFYQGYHQTLIDFFNILYEKHKKIYHLNVHSMPSAVVMANFPHAPPDIILGDRDGRSCGLSVRNAVAESLRSMGYRVAINQLYKGAEIITRYGQPAWDQHSLQIEINRAIFMDERTREKTPHFNMLKENVQKMIDKSF